MNDQLVTVARFTSPLEAHIARSRLEYEGIRAVVLDEAMITMNWLYSNALGGVRVQVLESNVEAAEEILETAKDPLRSSVPLWGKTEMWYLAFIAMVIVGTVLVGLR